MTDQPTTATTQAADTQEAGPRGFVMLVMRCHNDEVVLPRKMLIPAALRRHAELWASRNHSQTLQRLRERGGLSILELLAVVEGFRWGDIKRVPHAEALERAVAIGVHPVD